MKIKNFTYHCFLLINFTFLSLSAPLHAESVKYLTIEYFNITDKTLTIKPKFRSECLSMTSGSQDSVTIRPDSYKRFNYERDASANCHTNTSVVSVLSKISFPVSGQTSHTYPFEVTSHNSELIRTIWRGQTLSFPQLYDQLVTVTIHSESNLDIIAD